MSMKVAIVHDSFLEFGGAEKVIQSLLKIYPDADIYTSLIDEKVIKTFFRHISRQKIHTFPIIFFPKEKTSLLQLVAPFMWKRYSFENYDLVISSSAGFFANCIRVAPEKHILYIHSVPKNIFGLSYPKRLQNIFPYSKHLQKIYKEAISNSKYLISNSKYTQELLKKLFNKSSKVIYPPVRIPKRIPKRKKPKYFLIVSRLDRAKNIESAIQAANQIKFPLKIVGQALDKKYEKQLLRYSNKFVDFLGYLPDDKLPELFSSSYAFIVTANNEDFGISAVEAMAHGVPIISYYGGGPKEIIRQGLNGLFFKNYSVNSLSKIMRIIIKKSLPASDFHLYTSKFSEDIFIMKLKLYIKTVIISYKQPLLH